MLIADEYAGTPAPAPQPRARHVSVVIPTRDRPLLLAEALASVRALEGPDLSLEILVADDGNSPETASVIAEYGAIRVGTGGDKGAAAARNAGMGAATAPFIAFIDDDDVWTSDHLRPHLDFLDSHADYGAVVGRTLLCGPLLEPTGITWPAKLPSNGRLFGAFFDEYPQIGATVIRASVRETVGYMDENLFGDEDWDWHLRLARTEKVGVVPVVSTHFRDRPAGTHDDLQWERLHFLRVVFARHRAAARAEGLSRLQIARTWLKLNGIYAGYFMGSATLHAGRGDHRSATQAFGRAIRSNPVTAARCLLRYPRLVSSPPRALWQTLTRPVRSRQAGLVPEDS